MDERINYITSEMQNVADDAKSTFGGLSSDQLNWKPGKKSWSVAQCLDHLIKTNEQLQQLNELLRDRTGVCVVQPDQLTREKP